MINVAQESYTASRDIDPRAKYISKDMIDFVLTLHFKKPVPDGLNIRCRKRELCYPRQVTMFIYKNFTELSLKSIGDIFGFDHTTVIHSNQKIKDLMDVDDNIYLEVNEIIEKIMSMRNVPKIDSQEVLITHYREIVRILANLRLATSTYDKTLGVEDKISKKKWEERADAYLAELGQQPIIEIDKP